MALAFRIAEVAVGSALVILIMTDVFQSVILPRAATLRWRPSGRVNRAAWPLWRGVAWRIADADRREDFFASFAPLALVVSLVLWVTSLIVGYGLIFLGLREQVKGLADFPDALYFAGTSLITIGFGDLYATAGPARFIAIVAGASGLGVVAVTTTFLFSIFGAFASREVFVVTFGTRAGSPPSGVTLLETYGRYDIVRRLNALFDAGHTWMAAVLESHRAYPTLAYFRSSHDYESWVGTLGALLDAAALTVTVLDEPEVSGEARLCLEMGRHATDDLARFFRAVDEGDPGIEPEEFRTAHARLAAARLKVRPAAEAWTDFAAVRARYAGSLNAMARYWSIPPAQWIGDRSVLPHGKRPVVEAAPNEVEPR